MLVHCISRSVNESPVLLLGENGSVLHDAGFRHSASILAIPLACVTVARANCNAPR